MITFDSIGAGANTGGTSASWQHVIGQSATALVVGVSFSGGSPSTIARTVKMGTRTFVSLGVLESTPTSWTELFVTLAPRIGAQTITLTTSAAVQKTANSVAYRGVVEFGSVSIENPAAGTYSVTQPAPSGTRLVGVFGAGASITFNPVPITGTLRYARSTPTLAIVDEISPSTSITLELERQSQIAAPAAVITVQLVPVAGSTGLAYSGYVNRPITATTSATASSTSDRFGDTGLAVTAQPSATAEATGMRLFQASLAVQATVTASARIQARASATLPVTVSRPADRKVTRATIAATRAITVNIVSPVMTKTDAVPPPPASSSPLRYVGRYPDTEGTVAPRSYAVAANNDTKLTQANIDDAINDLIYPLAKTSYVNQQDQTKALKTDVTAADQNYFAATGHGLAVLDSTGYVAANQIPMGSIITNRVAACHATTLGSGTVSASGWRSLSLGTINIPDPGYAYVVMPFGWITGSDPDGVLRTRWSGTGNTAKVAVLPTTGAEAICGLGICVGSQKPSSYPITPAVNGGVRSQRFTGAITLGIYGSVLVEAPGRSYTFGGGTFYVLVLPAT